MALCKNGMIIYIPYILEEFIKKMDLDARQERYLTIDEFKQSIAYFRLSPDDWKKILEDLKSTGIIEEYNKKTQKIFFR